MMPSLPSNVLSDLNMICLSPMAEVQSKHIHASTQQAANHVLATTAGSHRRDYFSATQCLEFMSFFSRHDIACFSMSLPFAVVLQQLISSAPKPLRVNAAPLSGDSRVFSRVTFARYFLA